MTGIERQQDRQNFYELACQIETTTSDLLEYSRNHFFPMFSSLHHLVAEGQTGISLYHSSYKFRDAVHRLAEYRHLQPPRCLICRST